MAKKITIENIKFADCPSSASECIERAKKLCVELEDGNILFFPTCPFDFPQQDIDFLLKQKQNKAKNRKNIAYKPNHDRLTNADVKTHEEMQRLIEVMKNFSQKSSTFLSKLLTPYGSKWIVDYASFRPFEEKGRKLRIRARNDLLHTDAFPSRPMHGNRILRFFMNINPSEGRKWMTSLSFQELVEKYGGTENLPFPSPINQKMPARLGKFFKKTAKNIGFPVSLRSPYDQFMLNLHHFLKENEDFQSKGPKDHWEFPPGSCWAVFTDSVTHAAMQGQYALEQTFILPRDGLISPEKAPISILERVVGWTMTDSSLAN
ncbi:MAG: Kdo hydroxylase family protein [Chlamydiota bacterium]|jgi:hypothetical protein